MPHGIGPISPHRSLRPHGELCAFGGGGAGEKVHGGFLGDGRDAVRSIGASARDAVFEHPDADQVSAPVASSAEVYHRDAHIDEALRALQRRLQRIRRPMCRQVLEQVLKAVTVEAGEEVGKQGPLYMGPKEHVVRHGRPCASEGLGHVEEDVASDLGMHFEAGEHALSAAPPLSLLDFHAPAPLQQHGKKYGEQHEVRERWVADAREGCSEDGVRAEGADGDNGPHHVAHWDEDAKGQHHRDRT
mmetsp:Transcript_79839/g.231738  ORF Transcript_79839/g.231738 Transcript_79839/m.231738 type:complete len:245 (-) Transcript_79839:19-753(-)